MHEQAFLTSVEDFSISFIFYFYFETENVMLYSPCWPGIWGNHFEDYLRRPPEEFRLSDTECRRVGKQVVFYSNDAQLLPSYGHPEHPVLVRFPYNWDPDTSAILFSPASALCPLYPSHLKVNFSGRNEKGNCLLIKSSPTSWFCISYMTFRA